MNRAEKGGAVEQEAEKGEKGINNRILMKIMRHGEKTPGGLLTDYGRKVTEQNAEADADLIGEVDKIKSVGSNYGPKGKTGLGRSLETADVYGEGITLKGNEGVDEANRKIEKYVTRGRILFEISGMKSEESFNWGEYYNSKLPESFDQLSDEEKSKASHVAQEACVNRLLTDPKAEDYRNEVAARHAVVVDRYIRMIDRLDGNTKVMYPMGAHGGFMEPFLKEVLIRKLKNGQEVRGFQNVEEIGGAFRPSEGFFIDVTTDEEGNKKVKVFMDDPKKMEGEELTLDLDKLKELADYYREKNKE